MRYSATMNFKLLLNSNNGNNDDDHAQQHKAPASSSSSAAQSPVLQAKPSRFSIDSMINNDNSAASGADVAVAAGPHANAHHGQIQNQNVSPTSRRPHLQAASSASLQGTNSNSSGSSSSGGGPIGSSNSRALPLPGRVSSPLAAVVKKPSINSLTNDNDIDIKGNETPLITNRLSASSSVGNSPVVARPSMPLPPFASYSRPSPPQHHQQPQQPQPPHSAGSGILPLPSQPQASPTFLSVNHAPGFPVPSVTTPISGNSYHDSFQQLQPQLQTRTSFSRASPPNILNDGHNSSQNSNGYPSQSFNSSRKASSITSLLGNDAPIGSSATPSAGNSTRNSISTITNVESVGPASVPAQSKSKQFQQPVQPLQSPARKEENNDLLPPPPLPKTKKSITEELQQLEKLENKTAAKPKKYLTPPIWAQNWIALVSDKQGHNGNANNINNILDDNVDQPKDGHGTNYVAKERSKLTYSNSLDVSITKVIPYEDLTRKVTQWLYSHLMDIKQNEPDLLEFIELEVKLGRIWSKELDARIDFPISTETILTDQINYYFKPGVENSMFVKLEDFLMKNNAKSNSKNFTTLKSDTVDFFYHGVRRQDKPYDLRVSQDKDTKRIINQIEKRRVGDLLIYNPSNILDFRLSLSLEIPIKEVPKAIAKETANMKRRKIRTSYISDPCKNRFDLTKTYTFHQDQLVHSGLGNAANKKPDMNYEVEIEIDSQFVLESFNNLFVSTDNQTYEDSIKVMLDNARILNRSLS